MAGLVPGIQSNTCEAQMAGTTPAMTQTSPRIGSLA